MLGWLGEDVRQAGAEVARQFAEEFRLLLLLVPGQDVLATLAGRGPDVDDAALVAVGRIDGEGQVAVEDLGHS
jgi:hypothetical protein